jgi:4-hydroxy-tetrahydrodipicolinate synthase
MEFTPRGIYTPLVTLFAETNEFDEPTFRRLIDFQINAGAAGLLVIGDCKLVRRHPT